MTAAAPSAPSRRAPRGFVIAAPSSGSGKTVTTLALLRAFRRAGHPVASAKAGPDYIDPRFHEAASGSACVNLDAWAMRPARLHALAAEQGARALTLPGADASEPPLVVVEGVMGLFDGASDGSGSTADLAVALGLPVVLVVDAARQAQSVAALVRGFRDHRADVALAGVILNRVGSIRHEAMLRASLEAIGVRIFGAVPRETALALPERHLGLVQAGEHAQLEAFLDAAADVVAGSVDLDSLLHAAAPLASASAAAEPVPGPVPGLAPLGQRIAVADDAAFAFSYPHVLEGWRTAGAEILPFSPLADEEPPDAADAVFLPGGYPELHAGKLAAAQSFLSRLCMIARRGTPVYGECGGYMVLGEAIVDAKGNRHAMAGLLPLETSFAERRLHLGYRRLTPLGAGPWAHPVTAHEFHYATIVREGAGDRAPERLFAATDAQGQYLGAIGLRSGVVCGSFAHVIDRA